mgnify:CR=1 FL=1
MFIYAGVQDTYKMLEYVKAMSEQDKAELQIKVRETTAKLNNWDKNKRAKRAFKFMAIVSVIGIVGDIVGGLFAIAAQIALYTSLLNMRSIGKKQ